MRRVVSLAAVTATIAALSLIAAGPSAADPPPTITTATRLYVTENTTLDFTGADSISGENRTISVANLTDDTDPQTHADLCDISSATDYSGDGCAHVVVSVDSTAAGNLNIPNLEIKNDSPDTLDHVLAPSGAVITNDSSNGVDPSQEFAISGTPDELNNTLATLQFIPTTNFVDTELASADGQLPDLNILATNGGDGQSDSADTTLKVEGTNQAPSIVLHTASNQAVAGETDQPFKDDADILDPDLCTAAICGTPYTNTTPIADPDSSMLLVAWLDPSCGSFTVEGTSDIADTGSVSNNSVDNLLKNSLLDDNDNAGYNADQRAAIEASLDPNSLTLDLSDEVSANPTVYAGIGTLANIDYLVENIDYSPPNTAKTCHLNMTVSDLGNLGLPQKYDESTNPGYEIPTALGDSAQMTFDVVDLHPHVTVEQTPASPPGPEPYPGVDPTHVAANFLITFDQQVHNFNPTTMLDTGDSTILSAGPVSLPGLPVTCVTTNITPNLVWEASCMGPPHKDGTIKLKIDAGVVYARGPNSDPNQDMHDGDPAYANLASTSMDNSVGWDVTDPTVTIDPDTADGQAVPATTGPIKYTVNFSETTDAPVAFTASDVDLSQSTVGGHLVAHVYGPNVKGVPPHPNQYTVTVTGMTTAGNVIATIPSGVILDEALNPNDASTSTNNDNVIPWQPATLTNPSVTIDRADTQADPVAAGPIHFTAVFSSPVTGFTGSDISFAGSTAGGTLSATVTDSGDHQTYDVAVSGMTTSGDVVVSIGADAAVDASLNGNTASTSTDNTVGFVAPSWSDPTVTINAAAGQADPTNGASVQYTVHFSTPVIGFGANDISFDGSTVQGPLAVTDVSGIGDTYTVTVSGYTSDGIVEASVRTGAATTTDGQFPSVASTSTVNQVTVDRTPPSVDVEQAGGQADPVNAGPITFTATFSEPVPAFGSSDVDLSASTAGGPLQATVSGGPTVYTISVSGMSSDGTVVATIPAAVVTDAAGNDNLASTSTDNSVTYDTTPPSVTINQAGGQADPTSSSPVTFTVVFSKPVSGFVGAGVDLSGSSAGGPLLAVVSGGPTTYEVDVSGMTQSGDVVATVPAGAATDAASNASLASTSTDNSVIWVKLIGSDVTVMPSLSTAVYGQSVTANAMVTPTSGSAAGTVQFAVDGVGVGGSSGVVSGAAASPPLTGPGGVALAPGSHTVSATFTPSDPSHYNGAFGSTTVVVDQAQTTTAVSVTAHALHATVGPVAPGAGSPGGTVTFSVDGSPVGTAPVSGGVATFAYTTPAGMAHTVGAAYSGDTDFVPSSASTSRHDPTITAHVTSAHAKTKYGWYRTPVTVSFTCTTNGAPLAGGCPAKVTLMHNGAAQVVSRTIAATDGGMATASTQGISIDRTGPTVKITGVTNGATYTKPGPKPKCVATDALSGVASCTVAVNAVGGSSVVDYKAVATDRAGNVTTATGSYRLSGVELMGVAEKNGAFTVQRTHTYLLVVDSATRPSFIDAAPYPQTPFHPDAFPFRKVGHDQWALAVTFTAALHSHRYWNIGVKIGPKLTVLTVRVLAP